MTDSKTSVLLVLPESRERSQLSLILRDMDYIVHTCPDPLEAIGEMGRNAYSLAIVDQEQPGFSGSELVRQMRRLRTPCHIVMLTTDEEAEALGSPSAHGLSEFIYRPIQPRRLTSRLEIILKKPLPPASAAKKTKPAKKEGVKKMPSLSESLTRTPFQSVSSETYNASFLVAHSHLGRELLRQLWQTRNFKHSVVLRGETGSEFELVARELNTMAGFNRQFPIQLQSEDLRDTEFLDTHQAQAELRGQTGRMIIIEDAANFDERQRDALLDYLESNRDSKKRQLRFVICITGNEEDYDADCWCWIKKVQALAEATIEIAPLRDRQADIPAYARKIFYEITSIHPFLSVRDFEDAAIDCLTDYKWPGNYMNLITVMRSALANCHTPSLTLHQIQPHLVESNIARHLMESVADEKLLYPDFAAANG